jgi:hypothetical protein
MWRRAITDGRDPARAPALDKNSRYDITVGCMGLWGGDSGLGMAAL